MTKMKKSAVAFGVACALTLSGGLVALKTVPALAEGVNGGGYYGGKLTDPLAVAFYNELVAMTKPTDFEELSEFRMGLNHEVALDETALTAEMVEEAFTERAAGKTLAKSFGAALDSFRYDYADLFYINFDLLTFDILKSEKEKTEEQDPVPEEELEDGDDDGPEYEYKLIIGAGRGQSYFIDGVTMEDLNAHKVEASEPEPEAAPADEEGEAPGTDEPGEEEGEEPETPDEPQGPQIPTDKDGLYVKYTNYLNAFVEGISKGANVKETALAVNNAILSSNYDYGYDSYSNTTYSLVPANEKRGDLVGSSEGLARVYKTVLEAVDSSITCVIVSGYYIESDGNTVPWTWNYVQDGENWYAVDVARNLIAKNDDYFWLSGDVFYFDHFEESVLSLLNYKMPYPELKTNDLAVDTGELLLAKGTYEEGEGTDKIVREGIAVKYSDLDALRIRIKVNGEWSAWMTLEDYAEFDPNAPAPDEDENEENEVVPQAEEGEVPPTEEDPGEGEEPEPDPDPEPDPEPLPKFDKDTAAKILYLYNLKEGEFEVGVFEGENLKISSGKIRDTLHYVPLEEESIQAAQKVQTITGKPITVTIKYDNKVILDMTGAQLTIEYTISSPLGRPFNEEEVKQYCALTDAAFDDETNTVTFKFTPSPRLDHSGLRYTFKITNLATEAKEGEESAVPFEYSLVFALDTIRAGKILTGSNSYVDNITQPSLVYNNNLSVEGWKYDSNKTMTQSMLSGVSLTVNRPDTDSASDINDALAALFPANGEGEEATPVLKGKDVYTLTLTFEGKRVTLPKEASLQLSFPYPEGYGPESSNVTYKVVQYAAASNGALLIESYEIYDVVALRQGLVIEVNQPSGFFAVVVLDSEQYGAGNEKIVLLQTSGLGGTVKVNTDKLINVLHRDAEDEALTYTITPADGYTLDYVLVNGVARTLTPTEGVYTLTLNYASLSGTDTVLLYVEFIQSSVKAARGNAISAQNVFAEKMGAFQLSGTPYDDEDEDIVRDYPSISIPGMPPEPWSLDSTTLQMIILAGVVGGIALIGAVAIVYFGAIKPKKVREQQEEEARLAAAREKKANRNRMGPGGPGGMGGPRNYPPMR